METSLFVYRAGFLLRSLERIPELSGILVREANKGRGNEVEIMVTSTVIAPEDLAKKLEGRIEKYKLDISRLNLSLSLERYIWRGQAVPMSNRQRRRRRGMRHHLEYKLELTEKRLAQLKGE